MDKHAPAGGCNCGALNCPQCSSAETIEPVIVRATGMIRRARLTEAELDVCMQVGLHAVYAARRLDAARERLQLQIDGVRRGEHLQRPAHLAGAVCPNCGHHPIQNYHRPNTVCPHCGSGLAVPTKADPDA